MIGVTKRILQLDKTVAKDIVQRYREAYHRDDMTLLVVSAWRAINFLETWLEMSERGQMDQATQQPVERPKNGGSV